MKIDRKFMGRFATYLLGVAIGLVLLGLIKMQRGQPRPPAAEQATSESAPAAQPGR